MLEDGERVSSTLMVIGSALLTTLNMLEQANLLKVGSSIPNIPTILSMYFEWIPNFGDAISSCDSEDWPQQIVAYAEKHDIEIKGLYNVTENLEGFGTESLDEDTLDKVNSPPAPDKFGYLVEVFFVLATLVMQC